MVKGRLLSTGQIARLCGVTSSAVFNWIRSGGLTAARTPGRQFRVDQEDLVRYLKQRGAMVPAELARRPTTVLVVDDDPRVLEVVAGTIRQRWPGWEVATAKDGYAAGKLVHTLEPDLVILDLIMPGVDGFKVCRDIKSHPRTRGIKVLVITGYGSDPNVRKALEAGADSLVKKPLTPDDIERAVQTLLAASCCTSPPLPS